MAFTRLENDIANISKLSDRPNQNDGLSSAQLKGRFDKAGNDIKTYINDVLLKELERTSDTHIADTLKHKQAASIVQSGILANAEGYFTEASGEASHAEGKNTHASGNNSHAEGYLTVALGANSHAEGVDTEAGVNAHAEGASTKALGGASHAEGAGTETSGDFAHAEGQGTKAIGQASHAEGAGAEAKGAYSHAGGEGTIAKGYAQTAIGVFNVEQGTEGAKAATDHALIIGNGTDEARANALAVKWNGDTDIAGDMNIPSGKKYKINGTALAASDVGAVATTDIVNDLTTGGTAVPLSAEQGKTLKGEVGTLASLTTTEKGSLVGAINEVKNLVDTILEALQNHIIDANTHENLIIDGLEEE